MLKTVDKIIKADTCAIGRQSMNDSAVSLQEMYGVVTVYAVSVDAKER